MANPTPFPINNTLNQIPVNQPVIGQNGMMTQAWVMFFQQLYQRAGSPNALQNVNLNFTAPTATLATVPILITNTTIYTSPTGLSTVIDSCVFNNATGAPITFTAYLVPVNDTPATQYILASASIAAGASFALPSKNTFGSGAQLIAIASAVGITATLSGRNAS